MCAEHETAEEFINDLETRVKKLEKINDDKVLSINTTTATLKRTISRQVTHNSNSINNSININTNTNNAMNTLDSLLSVNKAMNNTVIEEENVKIRRGFSVNASSLLSNNNNTIDDNNNK